MAEADLIRERYLRRAQLPPGRYSPFNRGNLFIVQQRERLLLKMLAASGLAELGQRRILEIGCGDGYWLRKFVEYGAAPGNLSGVDLLEDRVARGCQLSPNINLSLANAEHLGFRDRSFDIVLQSTVFSSILDPSMRVNVAREMVRVLRDDGRIIWYDFRYDNPANPDVRGICRREVRGLFPRCPIEFRRTTLIPPLARRLGPVSWGICELLSLVPTLLSHELAVIRKP